MIDYFYCGICKMVKRLEEQKSCDFCGKEYVAEAYGECCGEVCQDCILNAEYSTYCEEKDPCYLCNDKSIHSYFMKKLRKEIEKKAI